MAEQELPFIRFLIQASNKQARGLLGNITRSQVTAIAEVCYNLLQGQLEPHLLEDLRIYKHLIRKLADKEIAFTERKDLIIRSCGRVIKVLRLAESILP